MGAPIVALGPLSVGNTFVTLGTNYFFGGTDGTNTYNDTWAITQGTVLATQMHPATSPPARHDQAAVAFNSKMYLFGGEDAAGNSLSDVWAFDPIADTWQQQPSQAGAQAWPGGFDAVAVAIGQQIILYGGSVSSGGLAQPAAAFAYAYNPAGGSWTRLSADPLGPDPGATAAAFAAEMYVFSSSSSTIESFDPVANTWSAVAVQGMWPAPREHAAGAADLEYLLAGPVAPGARATRGSSTSRPAPGPRRRRSPIPASRTRARRPFTTSASRSSWSTEARSKTRRPSSQFQTRTPSSGVFKESEPLLHPIIYRPVCLVWWCRISWWPSREGRDTYFVELSGSTPIGNRDRSRFRAPTRPKGLSRLRSSCLHPPTRARRR